MENELRQHLLYVAGRYSELANCALSTVSRRCRNDSSFFERISDPSKSFTVKTYDEVIAWFAANWPESAPRPALFRTDQPAA